MRLWDSILSSENRYFDIGWALIERDTFFVYDRAGERCCTHQWKIEQLDFLWT
jgi:hypothetical protein